MLEVYLDPCTINCRKALAGLDLIGAEYKVHHVDYFKSEHKGDAYKKINPCAKLPAGRDGEVTICESNAILQYAGDLFKNDTAYPKDLKQRALVNSWLLWETSEWFPSCYIWLIEYIVQPLLGNKPSQENIDNASSKFHTLAKILDDQLGKSKYLVGDEPTIADIAIASSMHGGTTQQLPLKEHPNLARWYNEYICSLKCWQDTQGAVDKALQLGKHASNGVESTTNGTANGHKEVRANFNYTKQTDQVPEVWFYEDDQGKFKDTHDPGDDPHQMTVTDGWDRAEQFSIDKNGFALKQFKTSFNQWEGEDIVKKEFYPEVVDYLKKSLGASRVLIFDHTMRTQANAAQKITTATNTTQRAPVMLVHCDYTAESGPTRLKQLLPDEADELLRKRVVFINVWKPVNRIVEERPLAMCDVASAPADDFFKLHLRYRERDGETYVMRHSDQHQWIYFPRMTPEQIILLKTYDSETDGRARFVGHSAFEDPSSPENPPARESIEIRTICFFD